METLQSHTIPKMSSLQLELLKVYSFNPTEEELMDIKRLLGIFFGKKLSMLADIAIEKKGITDNDLDKWLNEENQ